MGSDEEKGGTAKKDESSNAGQDAVNLKEGTGTNAADGQAKDGNQPGVKEKDGAMEADANKDGESAKDADAAKRDADEAAEGDKKPDAETKSDVEKSTDTDEKKAAEAEDAK